MPDRSAASVHFDDTIAARFRSDETLTRPPLGAQRIILAQGMISLTLEHLRASKSQYAASKLNSLRGFTKLPPRFSL